ASNRLGFSVRQTMVLAQQLYEGVELGSEGAAGLITYMRTDSLNLSQESAAAALKFIKGQIGPAYASGEPRFIKTKTKGAQEAHEAIRPTDPFCTPESIKKFLDARQFKLYDLIWRRFIASQMTPAVFDSTAVNVEGGSGGIYTFRATGLTQKFDGFLKVWRQKTEEVILPELKPAEKLELAELKSDRHFTEPPARFSEATLIKTLEKLGIGRPSTYAPIISVIQDRRYVEKDENKKFRPTDIGILVNNVLVEHFPRIIDYQFTAVMEEELDEIAEGKKEWTAVIREFYEPFKKNLLRKTEEVSKKELTEESSKEICEKCGKPMIVKFGRYGKFLACSGFPECKNTKPLEKPALIGVKCPKCGQGEIIVKKTKRGKFFFGCSRWPECDFALWDKPTGEKCPKCDSLLVEKRGQIKCSNKECGYLPDLQPTTNDR
ncbi:MAG: DNA topoisomerase, partial [bacterium]|nr:DNA topoisomerase [bacterium]